MKEFEFSNTYLDEHWVSLNSVAVIIPTINRPIETLRAVSSVLQQTYPINEIIVVDDGSSEENFILLKGHLQGLPVAVIQSGITRHPGRARNFGIKYSSSKWIAFLDSDDVWKPMKIEKQMKLVVRNNLRATCTNAFEIKSNETILSNLINCPEKLNLRRLLKSNFIVNSSVLVEAKLLREVGGVASSYSVRGVEDYATWLRIATRTNWGVLNLPLVGYSTDSEDTVRKDEEFLAKHNSYLAIFDFVSWLGLSKLAYAFIFSSFKVVRLVLGIFR